MGPVNQPTPEAPRSAPVELFVTEPLQASGLERFRMLVDRAVDMRPDQLVVDLVGCPAIDVVAIEFLLDVHRRVWRAGGRLTLRGPSPVLHRVLDLARVRNVFHVVPAGQRMDAVS